MSRQINLYDPTLRKQREDLVRSLLVGCAGLRQHDLFQEQDRA
jgi:hypothetical protein